MVEILDDVAVDPVCRAVTWLMWSVLVDVTAMLALLMVVNVVNVAVDWATIDETEVDVAVETVCRAVIATV